MAGSAALPAKSEFAVQAGVIELNNARWHPLSAGGKQAIERYLEFKRQSPFGQGESTGALQREVKTMFAHLVGAKPTEVSFVPSTTTAENLVVASLQAAKRGGNIVTDALHFEGSLYLYQALAKQGLDVRIIKPRDWRIPIADLEKVIDKKTTLVTLSLVSAHTGFEHDLKAVCELAHSRGAHVYADAVQAVGAIPVDVKATGVDFLAASSYKWLMGDMGLGFLYVKEDLLERVVRRVQFGFRQLSGWHTHVFPYDAHNEAVLTWEQSAGAGAFFEVGTISNTTVACLSHSLPYLKQLGVAQIQAHTQGLIQRLRRGMEAAGIQCLTPVEARSPIVTFVIPDEARVAARLQRAKVSVRLHDHLMRVSPSIYNVDSDIDALLEAVK